MKLVRKIPFVGIFGVMLVMSGYLLGSLYSKNSYRDVVDNFYLEKMYNGSVKKNLVEDQKPTEPKEVQISFARPAENKKLSLVIEFGTPTLEMKLDQIHSDLNTTRSGAVIPAFQRGQYLILNTQICQGVPTVDVIIIVHTRPGNFEKRQRMRETFANKVLFVPFQVRIAFLLGKPKDTTLTLLNFEHQKYKDTIMGDFDDDYHNLTLKGVMGFHWVSQYCPNSRFVLKIDDDVMIDMFNLLTKYMDHMKGKTRSIFCNVWKKKIVGILRGGKWKVPHNLFKKKRTFPYNYCSGFTVLLTSDLMRPLYEAATITPFFWIDDVYLFGMLPRIAGNITYYNYAIGQSMTLDPSKAMACWDKYGHECSIVSLLVDNRMYWATWERIKKLHSHPWKGESIFEA